MGAIPINPDKAAPTKAIRYEIGTDQTAGDFIGTGISLIELTDWGLVEILQPSHGTAAFHESASRLPHAQTMLRRASIADDRTPS
jgi:hypothetical protein